MTQEEKLTVVDRASKVFQEWLSYLQDAGTKFNLCPREDIDEAFAYWNERFMTALGEELDMLALGEELDKLQEHERRIENAN